MGLTVPLREVDTQRTEHRGQEQQPPWRLCSPQATGRFETGQVAEPERSSRLSGKRCVAHSNMWSHVMVWVAMPAWEGATERISSCNAPKSAVLGRPTACCRCLLVHSTACIQRRVAEGARTRSAGAVPVMLTSPVSGLRQCSGETSSVVALTLLFVASCTTCVAVAVWSAPFDDDEAAPSKLFHGESRRPRMPHERPKDGLMRPNHAPGTAGLTTYCGSP